MKEREAAGFTSALRETFKTIVFPMRRQQVSAQGRRLPHGVRPQRLFRRAADHRHADQARQVHPDRSSSTPSSTTSGSMPRNSCSTPTLSSNRRSGAMLRCGPAGSGCRAAASISSSGPPCSAASGARRMASSPRNGSGVRECHGPAGRLRAGPNGHRAGSRST